MLDAVHSGQAAPRRRRENSCAQLGQEQTRRDQLLRLPDTPALSAKTNRARCEVQSEHTTPAQYTQAVFMLSSVKLIIQINDAVQFHGPIFVAYCLFQNDRIRQNFWVVQIHPSTSSPSSLYLP